MSLGYNHPQGQLSVYKSFLTLSKDFNPSTLTSVATSLGIVTPQQTICKQLHEVIRKSRRLSARLQADVISLKNSIAMESGSP
ncbi:hypothetical protein TNCV_3954051 [Trichonephila clavipes]|nr:hypothetical protein TNCV_3954051 [Trichonephila clavipes]